MANPILTEIDEFIDSNPTPEQLKIAFRRAMRRSARYTIQHLIKHAIAVQQDTELSTAVRNRARDVRLLAEDLVAKRGDSDAWWIEVMDEIEAR